MKQLARLTNQYNEWDAKRSYKVGSIAVLNGNTYQNTTGKNTRPELLTDWIITEKKEIEVLLDGVLVYSGYSISNEAINFNSNYVWRINQLEYINQASTILSIPNAAAGNIRIDYALGNTNNEIIIVRGPEGTTATPPAIPQNTVLIESFFVKDNGYTLQPQPENKYIERVEKYPQDYYLGDSEYLAAGVYGGFKIKTSTSKKLKYMLFVGAATSEIYPGKEYVIINETGSPLTIEKNAPFINENYKTFYLTNDLVLQNNTSATVFYINGRFELKCVSSVSSSGGTKILILDNNQDGSVFTQGVTGPIVLKTYTVPAGAIPKNCLMNAKIKMKKEGVAGTFWVSLTSISSGFAPIFQFNSSSPTNIKIGCDRNPVIKTGADGQTKAIYHANLTNATSDLNLSANAETVVNINVDVDIVFSLQVNVTTTTDKVTLESLILTVIEK